MGGLARSYLFVPGNRPERFAKAMGSGADAVIVDLEDAVPPAEKEAAREALANWLSPAASIVVRVNATDTPWFDDDLRLCEHAGVAAVMLPKAERVDQLERVIAYGRGAAILPLVETAAGFANLEGLAAGVGVQRLMFGSLDLQLDLGIEGDGDELLYFRSRFVLASRIAGVAAPVDGVTAALGDESLLESDSRRGKRLGFGGKLCIHPCQVETVNRCYAPGEADIAWARRVRLAAARSAGAAVTLDGKMVDRPVMLRAEAILRAAGAVG